MVIRLSALGRQAFFIIKSEALHFCGGLLHLNIIYSVAMTEMISKVGNSQGYKCHHSSLLQVRKRFPK